MSFFNVKTGESADLSVKAREHIIFLAPFYEQVVIVFECGLLIGFLPGHGCFFADGNLGYWAFVFGVCADLRAGTPPLSLGASYVFLEFIPLVSFNHSQEIREVFFKEILNAQSLVLPDVGVQASRCVYIIFRVFRTIAFTSVLSADIDVSTGGLADTAMPYT